MADDEQMQSVLEKLNSINGVWRPFVVIGLIVSSGVGGTVSWSLYQELTALRLEHYRGQEAQNQRLSELEAKARAQDQFVNLAEMQRTITLMNSNFSMMTNEVAALKTQIAQLGQQLRELSMQQQRR